MSLNKSFDFVQVVGNGAIGSLLAAGLETIKQPYGCAPRRSPVIKEVKTIGKGTVILSSNQGIREALQHQDLLIFPLKVYQLKDALKEWRNKIHPGTTILVIQNGMGGEDVVKKILPNHPLLLATTSHGALKSAEHVIHTGSGQTKIGANNLSSASWQANAVTKLLQQTLAPVMWENNISHALWQKLAINAVINPLTALHGIPNGELAKPEHMLLIQQICEEVAGVMQAYLVPTSSEELMRNCMQVVHATAQNYSSMHQDVMFKRKTEIDAINGFIVEMAQKKGIDVPINTQLVKQIKAL